MLSAHTSRTINKKPETICSEQQLRLMVVDDSPALLEAICEVVEVEHLAHVVGRARDGVEAVLLASVVRPDLLLMDVTMPNMSGLEAAELVRKELPATRIILMSGEETLEMHQLARAAGADGFIFKSSFPEDFVSLLDQIFTSNSLPS